MAQRIRRAAVKELHAELADRFPLAIAKFDEGPIRPLRVGIHADLIAALPELAAGRGRKMLQQFIRQYSRSGAYLASLEVGADRVDLAGEPCGGVTELEAESAAAALRARSTSGSVAP